MKLSKIISEMILSFVLVLSSFAQANAKRLTAAVADWTGGEISCQVAVSMLEEEMGYKIKRVVFPSGTGLWEAIAAGEIDFACESWPSYAEADSVMMNEDLIYEGKKSWKLQW
jgi:glycine betaine/proline transport system substrate-binding protein